ncbi:MAG: thermonuclease family protein [Acidimicrobiia bacterium]
MHVARVIDGDTIEVHLNGREESVRLIGIDTPETVHPSRPVECFGKVASQFTTDRLAGRTVRLEFDVERRDRYERLLAYVWRDNKLFNHTIVRRGYAQIATYPPNVKYVDRLLAAQRKARTEGAGLWSSCDAESSESTGAATGAQASSGKCDPNYGGACIPPYPPDLDCGEISATNFRSTGSDPHGFDGDGDGIACES